VSRFRHGLVALLLGISACGPTTPKRPTWPDAAVELRDDADRDQAIDAFWVLPPGADRDKRRAAIASATARRIDDAIGEDRPFVAEALLEELASLWESDPQNVGRGLAPHVALLEQLRAMFAKAGALQPAMQTLVLLAEVQPAQRAARLAELDEILTFADELAVADNGPNAMRSQPIALLAPTALALPVPWVVDRYVKLLVERQIAVSALLAQGGASMQLVRAHYDILSTQRRIAAILARAGRVTGIHPGIAKLTGIGADQRQLVMRAEMVSVQGTAESYAELAEVFRQDERAPDGDRSDRRAEADPAAALAVCVAGLAKFPDDSVLLGAAANDAHALGRLDLAITYAEAALRSEEDVDATAALRLGKWYGERIERLADTGRPRAAHDAWRGALAFTSQVARKRPHTVWQQAAAIAESSLGRGLAGEGLVSDARRALTGSLERAPSIDAYETLTAIEVQTDRFASANRWAASGLGMLGDTMGDRYRRARLERLAGDALLGAGRHKEAASHYLEGLRAWASLGDDKDLPLFIAAERKLEMGRAMLRLGDPAAATKLVARSIDLVPSSDKTPSAVALLIEADRFREAVDAFHEALVADLPDADKITLALWITGEARRRGEENDRLASEYLTSRQGDTWPELLARVATKRIAFDTVRAAATTTRRKAELAFYGATLGFHPSASTPEGKRLLLGSVIEARIVFDEEYDLARMYLLQPVPPSSAPATAEK
jgi:tetratricopeptide (TPR) repeat protein